jgi:hypothetical protein
MFKKLRVLGRRARVFSRARLLGVGWGCWQIYINNARCGRHVVVLTVGHIGNLGGILGRKLYILG